MNEISETELQSYLDGEASPETSTRVERYISVHPGAARRLREMREDKAQLRRYFTAVEANVPDRYIADTLRLVLEHKPRHRFAEWGVGMRVAAMFVLLVVGSAAIVGIKVSLTVPAFADAGALAYQEIVRKTSGTDADPLADPRVLIEWLNERTGLLIRVPYSNEHGFSLTDGRVTRFDRHAAGLLVYEDWRRHRVVIFVTRVTESDDPEPHFAFDRATYLNYWSRDGVGVVIAAENEQDLKEFTRTTRRLIDVSAVASGNRLP